MDEKKFIELEKELKKKLNFQSFKKFWDAQPTTEQFDKALGGVMLYSEMIYHMVANPLPKVITTPKVVVVKK